STMTKSRIARRCSIAKPAASRAAPRSAERRGQADGEGGGAALSYPRGPMQLAAQRRVIAPAARMEEAHAVDRAAHADAVAVPDLGQRLHVEVHRRVAAGDDPHLHLAAGGDTDRPA